MNKLKEWELNRSSWLNLPLAKKNEILDELFESMEEDFWDAEDGGEG